MWDLIQVTYEGTPEVRRARKNSLIQGYEAFWMEQGEIIKDVQSYSESSCYVTRYLCLKINQDPYLF